MGYTQNDFTGAEAGSALDVTSELAQRHTLCLLAELGPEMVHADQARKGIFGRGVLLDYARWLEEQGRSADAFSTHNVTTAELDAIASAQCE